MVQAYLFALFTHFVSKLLADLQFTFFGPEAMVEIFKQKEVEEKTENNIENGSANNVEKVNEEDVEKANSPLNGNGDVDDVKRSKFSAKKRSKMLDRLRRKRRKPKGKNSPFENGRSHSESDGNTFYLNKIF